MGISPIGQMSKYLKFWKVIKLNYFFQPYGLRYGRKFEAINLSIQLQNHVIKSSIEPPLNHQSKSYISCLLLGTYQGLSMVFKSVVTNGQKYFHNFINCFEILT
jgi:hypothetical protein